MDLVILNIFVIQTIIVVGAFFVVYRTISSLIKEMSMTAHTSKLMTDRMIKMALSIESLEKRIDAIFVVEPPKNSPNKVTQQFESGVEFSEDTILDLPKEVKFEVEGGDSTIPPQYAS